MADDPIISLEAFLETIPPSQVRTVNASAKAERVESSKQPYIRCHISWPEIQLHCTDTKCNGVRFFRCSEGEMTIIVDGETSEELIKYTCRNCQLQTRIFALLASAKSKTKEGKTTIGYAFVKIGEVPAFGPTTPARLISLIGPEREVFLKGRRAENQGLGIGAFAYYRRVVENQKGRIIENIAEAARRLGAPKEMVDVLMLAKDETQFSRAIDLIKEGISESLKINGHNPLTLLHSALSEGLHAQADEECLEAAQDIRLVLGGLADRIAQALKDDRELSEAVNRLLNRSVPGATNS
jgi:hypothetical protein